MASQKKKINKREENILYEGLFRGDHPDRLQHRPQNAGAISTTSGLRSTRERSAVVREGGCRDGTGERNVTFHGPRVIIV